MVAVVVTVVVAVVGKVAVVLVGKGVGAGLGTVVGVAAVAGVGAVVGALKVVVGVLVRLTQVLPLVFKLGVELPCHESRSEEGNKQKMVFNRLSIHFLCSTFFGRSNTENNLKYIIILDCKYILRILNLQVHNIIIFIMDRSINIHVMWINIPKFKPPITRQRRGS
jgi:preprotein translocase subunit SecG